MDSPHRASMLLLFFVISLVALICPSAAAEDRECLMLSCASNVTVDTVLTCGGSGEKFGKIAFASYGNPTAGSNCTSAVVNPTCHYSQSMAVIESQCLNKVECTISPELFANVDKVAEETSGCGATPLTLTVHAECREVTDPNQVLTAALLGFIGLALGSTLTIGEFKKIYQDNKRGILIGFISQFGFMPFMSYLFTKTIVADFSNNAKIGLILVGASPGGTTSNLLTYWVKGNVALSIAMSCASTLLTVVTLPLLISIYGVDGGVEIPIDGVVQALASVLLPVALGMVIRTYSPEVSIKVEKFGNVLGVILLALVMVKGMKENSDILEIGKFPLTWVVSMLYQPLGSSFGYMVAHLFRLDAPSKRAVAFETGVQSFGFTIAVISLSFRACQRKEVLTFSLCCTLAYVINSVWMVFFMKRMCISKEEATAHDKAVVVPSQKPSKADD